MVSRSPYICVVDDDDDIREALSCALELSGYRVVQASNGARALDLLRSDEGACGLILLDLTMPEMNGWEFRACTLEDRALQSIPVVVLSGVQDTPGARALAASAYVQKPIDLGSLLRSVRTHFKPKKEDARSASP